MVYYKLPKLMVQKAVCTKVEKAHCNLASWSSLLFYAVIFHQTN